MRFPPGFGGYTQQCNLHSPSGNRRLLPPPKGDSSVQFCNPSKSGFRARIRKSENHKQTKPSNPIVHPLFVCVWFRNLMATAYRMSHAKYTMYDMCILPRPGFEAGKILFATGLVYIAYVRSRVCQCCPLPCFRMMRGCLVPWVLLFGHFVVFGLLPDNPESRCHFSQHVNFYY